MRRREFVTMLGCAAAWPLGTQAQQGERMRRIGVLTALAPDDLEGQARITTFSQGLQSLGWIIGRNARLDIRWAAGSVDDTRKHATELATLATDVILAHGSSTVGPLLQATRTVPIVFLVVPDPVGAGFVDSLARPGRNATGFTTYEFGMGGKWLELLKQIAPTVTQAGVLRDPGNPTAIGLFGAIQSVAPSIGMEVRPISARDAPEIERSITAFARSPNGGLIVTGSAGVVSNRNLIITLAARHKLPAVYYERTNVIAGGLISYGPDYKDQFREAAGYVDRILKGEKPATCPYRPRPNTKPCSTSGPPRRSASKSRRRCSPPPTR
jgi:putative ABC transport system substrate-binding protein